MRRFLLASLAFVALITGASAQTMPLMQPPWDPGNALGTINSWLQTAVNPTRTRNLSNFLAAFTTTTNSIAVAYTYSLPGGTLIVPGSRLHIHAWGVNDSTATDVRTVTFTWGASGTTCAVNTTGASNSWVAEFDAVIISTVLLGGSAAQDLSCTSQASNGTTTPVQFAAVSAAPTLDNTAAIQVTVSLTAATAGTMTIDGAIVSTVK